MQALLNKEGHEHPHGRGAQREGLSDWVLRQTEEHPCLVQVKRIYELTKQRFTETRVMVIMHHARCTSACVHSEADAAFVQQLSVCPASLYCVCRGAAPVLACTARPTRPSYNSSRCARRLLQRRDSIRNKQL